MNVGHLTKLFKVMALDYIIILVEIFYYISAFSGNRGGLLGWIQGDRHLVWHDVIDHTRSHLDHIDHSSVVMNSYQGHHETVCSIE